MAGSGRVGGPNAPLDSASAVLAPHPLKLPPPFRVEKPFLVKLPKWVLPLQPLSPGVSLKVPPRAPRPPPVASSPTSLSLPAASLHSSPLAR